MARAPISRPQVTSAGVSPMITTSWPRGSRPKKGSARRAAMAGVEGHVTLSFSVDRGGRAKDIRVVGATEPGWFEEAAIVALRAWRFDPGKVGERYNQTFDFALSLDAIPEDREQKCDYSLGSRICRKVPAGVDGDFSTSKVETVYEPRNMLQVAGQRASSRR